MGCVLWYASISPHPFDPSPPPPAYTHIYINISISIHIHIIIVIIIITIIISIIIIHTTYRLLPPHGALPRQHPPQRLHLRGEDLGPIRARDGCGWLMVMGGGGVVGFRGVGVVGLVGI